MTTLDIDGLELQTWIDELAAFSDASPPAVTRVLFSDEDLQARAWVRRRCEAEGLNVRDDAVGNLFARWQGDDDEAPAVATGSHIDAIPHAGRYDGVVGVLGGLAAIRALRRAGFRPRRSLELIVFTAEEPTRFGLGCLGSRLLSGALSPDRAALLSDTDGHSLEFWRARAGLAGRDLSSARISDRHYAAFLELHIEQGPLLENAGTTIGAVHAIAGPSSYRVRLTGEGGHAGAVLMSDRHDAGLAAAEIALAVERAAATSGSLDTVGTTGVFRQLPNAINSIPFDVTLEIDVRDTDLGRRSSTWEKIAAAIAEIGDRRGVRWSIETINADPPATCAPALVETVTRTCSELGIPVRRMVSRAYHDALFMAQVCPTTMIFIPCRGGVSHRPDEYASPQDVATGATVLAHVLAQLSVGVRS
jgi:ureidoglycolate amidohydrolase